MNNRMIHNRIKNNDVGEKLLSPQDELQRYVDDRRIVLTLDAGGTKLEFSALTGKSIKVPPFILPASPDNLDSYLESLTRGFNRTLEILGNDRKKVAAISFGFPGPALYEQGIIGDLPNLPAFRGGVALKQFLEKKFSLPVFINNDGNLFALGEWIRGFLPWVNHTLAKKGKKKQYKNLIGVTLGTGFGCGIVINGTTVIGDNSSGGEIWLTRNKQKPGYNVESGVGKRGLGMYYAEKTGIRENEVPDAITLEKIARGTEPGDQKAAKGAYENLGIVAGNAIAHALTLIDGLVVIGGGLAKAGDLFLPSLMKELNSTIKHSTGEEIPRLVMKAYNLERDDSLAEFIHGNEKEIPVPDCGEIITYDAAFRTGIGFTKLGTSQAVGLGAYVFALNEIDKV
jgi:glucokinase